MGNVSVFMSNFTRSIQNFLFLQSFNFKKNVFLVLMLAPENRKILSWNQKVLSEFGIQPNFADKPVIPDIKCKNTSKRLVSGDIFCCFVFIDKCKKFFRMLSPVTQPSNHPTSHPDPNCHWATDRENHWGKKGLLTSMPGTNRWPDRPGQASLTNLFYYL